MKKKIKINIDLIQIRLKEKLGRDVFLLEIAQMYGVTYNTLLNWKKGENSKKMLALHSMIKDSGLSCEDVITEEFEKK